jgi:hypothetical protein
MLESKENLNANRRQVETGGVDCDAEEEEWKITGNGWGSSKGMVALVSSWIFGCPCLTVCQCFSIDRVRVTRPNENEQYFQELEALVVLPSGWLLSEQVFEGT